jgi:DNA-3-methyladenine glycosylase I
MTTFPDSRPRCPWLTVPDPLYVAYHDEEWGTPCHDERQLFEMLILEGAQAGLSWLTVLRRREGYRRAFDQFDVVKIARYGEADVARLLADPGIIRNRAKVAATIDNARAYLEHFAEPGSFDRFLWSFVDGVPKKNRFHEMRDYPAQTAESRALSKALQKKGFRFVGPTIVYALMQATGMVDDHSVGCFRHGR